jgi:dTDP-4-dehydrorhamnose 3,5-epimerase
MNIHPAYLKEMTRQSYGSKPTIEGVEIVNGNCFTDDGGHFTELFRLNEKGEVLLLKERFQVRQVSLSLLMPQTVKAFHIHYKQDDVWFVPPSEKLLVNLHDLRTDSSTKDKHMRVFLGDGKSQILRIPKGVAHGAANPYHRPMTLIYATSEQFDPKDPDEHRLPYDIFGAEVWEMTKG